MKNAMLFFFSLLAWSCVHEDYETAATSTSRCPGFQKFSDAIPAEGKLTVKHLQRSFEFTQKAPNCDEGVYSATHADIVTRAATYDTANTLSAMDANKTLQDFVLKHIDASADLSDLEAGLKNVRAACLKKKFASCDVLEAGLNEAIRLGATP